MGIRGPLPKRSGTRIGHISTAEQRGEHITKGKRGATIRPPVADPDWHPIAQRWYESLKKSGQSDFYEPSDWAFAYSLADDLSMYKKSFGKNGQRSSMMLDSLMKGMSLLLTTEGDRRRVNVELHEETEDDTSVSKSAVADYRALLAKQVEPVGTTTEAA